MSHNPGESATRSATATAASAAATGFRPFAPGQLLAGRFRIMREVAQGGMSVVYEAVDEKLNARRAIKCAKPPFAGYLSPEARSSLRVTHPNVCRVFEIHSVTMANGAIEFLTMEYLDGGTLAGELAARGRLPESEARDLALQICAGVQAAHAEGLLHRDLKPTNVLLARDGQGRRRAVVTDLGLAQEPSPPDRATAWSGGAGTLPYLAPERLRGQPATVASDIFALGILLHELVAGVRPLVAPSGERRLAADLPRRWHSVIARCLDPDPRLRYASAARVAEALASRTTWQRRVWMSAAAVASLAAAWSLFAPQTPAARLAVLPLVAIDADAETESLVRGASYDLSARLTRMRSRPAQLVVIPVEEAMNSGLEDAGAQLGATHVLRATVTQRLDRVLVRGAILDTSTKVPLREWSGEYAASGAAAIPSTLAAQVAAAFRLPRRTATDRVSPEAYAAYAEGMAALGEGNLSYGTAVAAFERAIALDPQSVLARAGLVEACYNAWVATSDAKWLTRGRDELAQAEALDSDSIAARLAAGRLHLVPGSFDRAAREYQRVVELDPTSAEGWTGLGRAFEATTDRDLDAAAALLKAVEVQPGYARALIDLGSFYRRRGNYLEAEKYWKRATEIAPRGLAGRSNLGALYADMGRYADAVRELTAALDIAPDSRVLNNIGSLYQYMGRDADAIAYFDKARALAPETHILLLNLGDSYRRLGRHADASDAYRRGLELAQPLVLKNPRDAATRSFVAYFALRIGDRATAERELVQALNSGGENRTVLRRAAICFEALGQRDRTLAVLELAPPDLLEELNRQPDLTELQADSRFIGLLAAAQRR